MNSLEADFCVVGAGYAGLTTAYRLQEAGHSVVVLEARDRVGGRVYTEVLPDGTAIDMGGTFIGPGQDHLYALVTELGCETTRTFNEGEHLLVYKGKVRRYKGLIPDMDVLSLASMWASMQQLNQMSKEISPEAPWKAPKAREWDAITLEQWINNPMHAFTDASRDMLKSLMSGMFT